MKNKTIKMTLPKCNEYGTPKEKMPYCPNCGEDELGMMTPSYAICYSCGIMIVDNWRYFEKYKKLRTEIERLNRQRNIEQEAWEETKKYQDEAINEQKLRIFYQDILYKICILFDKPDEKCNIHEIYDKVKNLL